MWSDVVHVALGDDSEVNVTARAQVIKDACSDGVTHQPLGFLLLKGSSNMEAQMKREASWLLN